MFHISNNKRALESAIQIRQGLERLIEKHPFNSITVSALCMESGVSRPTFYRLFDTPSDIIHWYCDQQSKELCKAFEQSLRTSHENPFHFNLRYILNHPESLELAHKAGRLDIADAAFYRNIAPYIKKMQTENAMSDDEIRLSSIVMSAVYTSAFRAWFESGKKESVDSFYERIVKIMKNVQ